MPREDIPFLRKKGNMIVVWDGLVETPIAEVIYEKVLGKPWEAAVSLNFNRQKKYFILDVRKTDYFMVAVQETRQKVGAIRLKYTKGGRSDGSFACPEGNWMKIIFIKGLDLVEIEPYTKTQTKNTP